MLIFVKGNGFSDIGKMAVLAEPQPAESPDGVGIVGFRDASGPEEIEPGLQGLNLGVRRSKVGF